MKTHVQECSIKNDFSPLYVISLSPVTPARTLFISGLKSRVLKLPFFYLKMMVKSGLDFLF